MATGKRHQSTRKLSQRITRHGYNISRLTVRRDLRRTSWIVFFPFALTHGSESAILFYFILFYFLFFHLSSRDNTA